MTLKRFDEDRGVRRVKENLDRERKRKMFLVGRTYEVVLEQCGMQSCIEIKGEGVHVKRTVNIESWVLKQKIPNGKYVEGVGYIKEIDFVDLTLLCDGWREMQGIVNDVLEQEEGRFENWERGRRKKE